MVWPPKATVRLNRTCPVPLTSRYFLLDMPQRWAIKFVPKSGQIVNSALWTQGQTMVYEKPTLTTELVAIDAQPQQAIGFFFVAAVAAADVGVWVIATRRITRATH